MSLLFGELTGEDGGCNGYDGLMELTVRGQEGGSNSFDGLLELNVCG
jgi:hypothetical protein